MNFILWDTKDGDRPTFDDDGNIISFSVTDEPLIMHFATSAALAVDIETVMESKRIAVGASGTLQIKISGADDIDIDQLEVDRPNLDKQHNI